MQDRILVGSAVRLAPGQMADECLQTVESIGTLRQDDGSSRPYQVQVGNFGRSGWYRVDEIVPANWSGVCIVSIFIWCLIYLLCEVCCLLFGVAAQEMRYTVRLSVNSGHTGVREVAVRPQNMRMVEGPVKVDAATIAAARRLSDPMRVSGSGAALATGPSTSVTTTAFEAATRLYDGPRVDDLAHGWGNCTYVDGSRYTGTAMRVYKD